MLTDLDREVAFTQEFNSSQFDRPSGQNGSSLERKALPLERGFDLGLHLSEAQAVDANRFFSGGQTANDLHCLARDPEQLCQQFLDHCIGSAIDWRRGDLNLQAIAAETGELIFGRTWLDQDVQRHTVVAFAKIRRRWRAVRSRLLHGV